MKFFSPQDISDYYDDTEVHYKMFWKFEETLGLHYAIWDSTTKNLSEAILNTNYRLAELGEVKSTEFILDAGCGVGGSSIYLAKKYGCKVFGVSLSEKQVLSARKYAEIQGVSHLTQFEKMDYNCTTFADQTFDVIWGIESIQTTLDKSLFFKEANRILKPNGRLLIADYHKPFEYNVDEKKSVKTMLNGWAISDIASLKTFIKTANQFGFQLVHEKDVNKEIYPSVFRLFLYAIPGTFGTLLYNWFVKKASYFSRIHYKTYYAQFFAYKKGLWKYKLLVLQKN